MALNNDFSLVILTPFNLPSGVPYYRNYSPLALNRPSGINFDWNVEITNSNTNEPQAVWPGTRTVFMPESGTFHTGYSVQGTSNTNAAATQTATEKCLILGAGGFAAKNVLAIPPVPMSGFTIGFWVSPQSDGFISRSVGGKLLGQRHGLIIKGNNTDALYLGVSGALAQGAQFPQDVFASGLSAFAVISNTTLANERRLSTPIESGAYTHLTFTYRFDPANGTAHQIALFKNGRLTASGTTSTSLTSANTAWTGRPITIGGSFTTTVTNRFLDATGWGHLVSGVYAYERPLNDGEVLQIHNQGGLQVPSNTTYPVYKSTDLTDPYLVTYCPFVSPGFIDVSRHHLNLLSNEDEGRNGDYIICPGPFNRAMVFNNTTIGVSRALGTPSGTINEILNDNGSFTLAGWFFLANIAQVGSSFDQTTLMSYGAVGSTNEFNPVRQTGGFQISASGNTNAVRISARFYDGGLVTLPTTTVLTHNDNDLLLSVAQHVAIVYDEQTFGAALYVNGTLAQSGTLPNSFKPLAQRLAYSGYPLLFLGGIPGEIVDSYSTLGGDACAVSEIYIAKRPLAPEEIRFIAESGIDITRTYYTVQDPRLRGYWPSTDAGLNDLLIPDRGMIFTSGGVPGHLTRILSDDWWKSVESYENTGQQINVDLFSQSRDTTLGITSGTFAAMSATDGIDHLPSVTGEHSRTSSSDYPQRYRMFSDQRDVRAPAYINEYIYRFEVTPSGNIPPVFGSAGKDYNSTLFYFGEPSATDHIIIYLTSAMAPAGSGITLVVQTQDNTTIQPLVSGNIPYGVTSKCMFHAKPLLPFNVSTTTPIQCSLWVNGAEVNKFVYGNDVAMLFDSDAPGTSDNWIFQVGGRAGNDIDTTHAAIIDGLGGIYLRNMSVLVGQFSNNDLAFIATSGILPTSNITNYKDTINTSPVYVNDSRLVGYWRFSGPDSGSGITDLSLNHNDLTHLARQALGSAAYANIPTNTANLLRFIPMPFLQSTLPVQASGITFKGRTPASSVGAVAPYAISGSLIQIPQSGFSVGCWMSPRNSFTTSAAILLSYGIVPTSIGGTLFNDSSWCLCIDDDSNVALILSQDGTMTTSDASEIKKSSLTKCRISRIVNVEPTPLLEVYRQCYFKPGHIDSMKHVAFTFKHSGDPNISGIVKGYLNGEKVAESYVPASGFHQPLVVETRMLSFLIPQTGVWSWNTLRAAIDPVMTDVFYASAPLGDEEIRHIAMFGISSPPATNSSGIIGGYTSGIQGATDYIGGYVDGLDRGSGFIGGYCQGVFQSSGFIGGYILGSSPTVSGFIGGYLKCTTTSSGFIGGYTIGAIPAVTYFDAGFVVQFFATSDFDAQLKVQKTIFSEFDAQVTVFQEERYPDVAIIIPSDTVNAQPPYNQYFIGSGRALQNKTITQAKFYFNDFSEPVLVTASGGTDLFPISHKFDQSGVYIVRFSVIDSNGQHNSATRVINLANGISPVQITLSGVPLTGTSPVTVQFSQKYESVPNGVEIITTLLDLDDGLRSLIENIEHVYSEVGRYRPVWIVKDSRGFIWGDSLEAGVNN